MCVAHVIDYIIYVHIGDNTYTHILRTCTYTQIPYTYTYHALINKYTCITYVTRLRPKMIVYTNLDVYPICIML